MVVQPESLPHPVAFHRGIGSGRNPVWRGVHHAAFRPGSGYAGRQQLAPCFGGYAAPGPGQYITDNGVWIRHHAPVDSVSCTYRFGCGLAGADSGRHTESFRH